MGSLVSGFVTGSLFFVSGSFIDLLIHSVSGSAPGSQVPPAPGSVTDPLLLAVSGSSVPVCISFY